MKKLALGAWPVLRSICVGGCLLLGAGAARADGAYDVGKISDTEYIRWESGNLWRVRNGASTPIPYETVSGNTGMLDGGKWYVVKDIVNRGSIDVGNGEAANLVLLDRTALTVSGVRVSSGRALNIFGVTSGALTANGVSLRVAGIGGGENGAGGTVTIYGGRVTATGGLNCAGIGGGDGGAGGTVTINGGTVMTAGGENAMDIGRGKDGSHDGSLTIDGGSVRASVAKDFAKNSTPTNVYCVTAKCEGLTIERLNIEGLGDYGTNDIYAVKGRVYLWLPDGTHCFSLSDGTTTCRYCAVVKGRGVTVEPLPASGFLVNGVNISSEAGAGWTYDGSVLSLTNAQVYVLSGEATNDEVQVKVAQGDARVVLSNAVVFTSGRPALDVAQSASLQMAGGTSCLVATNDSAAVSVATGAELEVGLEPGADASESMIGVFNYGNAKAISNAGRVAVDGGTFFVWADEQAVETPHNFACGMVEVMMTGETPEALRYAEVCDVKPCVLVGPAVTVTVLKDIPHVSGITVSNAVQAIDGLPVPPGAAYRVMLGDDMFIGYTVEEGYTSQAANPLVYAAIEGDVMVDANVIPTLQDIPYRAWNEATQQMEDKVCTSYAAVTNETAAFEDGQWYVVTNAVSCGTIVVNGAAHLILCDGATLTVNALTGGSLAVYGQIENSGALVVSGAVGTALTIVGGNVKAGAVTTPVKNAMGNVVHCVTCEDLEGLESLGGSVDLTVAGLESYGFEKARLMDGKVFLWLPNGTHWFTLSDGTTTLRYCAVVKGRAITVEPLPVGFFVNGVDIGEGPGTGWNYFNKCLTLFGVGPYVLSGSATNNEVGIVVDASEAKVILSNAVVFTSGRPALQVKKINVLQMAGGTSYLAATNGSEAVSVAAGAELEVGLEPGADEAESMIGVFNYGDPAAIAGSGTVAVNGGTLAVWADEQAVGTPDTFTCGTGEVMMTGETPETLRYVGVCDANSCVLVGPGVTVTVKDIPHVTDFTVSNAVQAIDGLPVPPGATYRVMLGDDMFIGYTVEEGYTSQAANPLVYLDVAKDFTVGAQTIPVLQDIPYRAWNEATRQMEDKVCTSYAAVTNETAAFEDGQWYVVTNAVSCGTIVVNGAAHLILCDGAELTLQGEDGEPGLGVMSNACLNIYGCTNGVGTLISYGGTCAAGIGGGGSWIMDDKPGADAGRITVNGGVVTAFGGDFGAGIGGGACGKGATLTVNGGTVFAYGGYDAEDIGGGAIGEGGVTVVNGGSVMANRINAQPTNDANVAVYCVTVEGLEGLGCLEGLEGYGTRDIVPIDGKVYLWLPNGTHVFTVDGVKYYAEVKDAATTAVPFKPSVILDTDLGSSMDDLFTVDLAARMHREGKIELKAVMMDRPDKFNPEEDGEFLTFADRYLASLGLGDLPIGKSMMPTDSQTSQYVFNPYWTLIYSNKVTGVGALMPTNRTDTEIQSLPNAVTLYRRLLADAPNKSVVVCSTGFLTNLKELMASGANHQGDGIDATGLDLIAAKVKELRIMAGCFDYTVAPDGENEAEYNCAGDPSAAKMVLEGWPTPVIVSTWEVGLQLEYQPEHVLADFPAGTFDPVLRAAYVYWPEPLGENDRNRLWDPMTLLPLTEGNALAPLSVMGGISVNEHGKTTFVENLSSNRCYQVASNMNATAVMNRFREIFSAGNPSATTCEGGSVAVDAGGACVVTPNEGVSAVEIGGLSNGVEVVGVKIGASVVPAAAFVGFGERNAAGVFSLALDPNGVVDGVPVTPTIGDLDPADGEPFVVGENGATLKFKTISGLYYELVRAVGDFGFGRIGEDGIWLLGDGGVGTLQDETVSSPAGAVFYSLRVTCPLQQK